MLTNHKKKTWVLTPTIVHEGKVKNPRKKVGKYGVNMQLDRKSWHKKIALDISCHRDIRCRKQRPGNPPFVP